MLLGFLIINPFVISLVTSYSNDNEGIASDPDPLDELHMDFVPTGYLPDSVYRELAWYGIMQIQPLYRSTKHKVAAQWIWQNTLGRPHVVVENQPQTTQSEDTSSHQTLLEESIKWSREQRTAQDVLMENVRNGGNGLTVRTVISATQKTVYIIQNGKYYFCEEGSEPDMEAFRAQTNLHERQCTSGKKAEPLLVQVDPCIEAEEVPLEYSFMYEWMFCFGDGARNAMYHPDGDLDCGEKKKMRYTDFLHDCAIDKNVVITYEYFGDEPRKDMVHNTTLCTSWDPCRISYLYRIEAPENKPEVPTSTQDPCDTTLCQNCIEGISEENLYPYEEDKARANLVSNKNDDIEWVPVTNETIKNYLNKAMRVGYLLSGYDLYLIRAVNFATPDGPQNITGFYSPETGNGHFASYGEEYFLTTFEVAIAADELKWVSYPHECEKFVQIGTGRQNHPVGICRTSPSLSFDLKPGNYYIGKSCTVANKNKQMTIKAKYYEVLCRDTRIGLSGQ